MIRISDDSVRYILKKLELNGFKGYIVGGCLRDLLLGKTPHDYDITTNATPDDIQKIFKNHKQILTGLKHGTVMVVHKNEIYEITTFRKESEYTDHRHPDAVSFTSDIALDLSRRDFTINAMAFNENEGLIDLFEGQLDLERKVVKTVNEADLRFKEDALRILRCIRFASVLDFSIDKETSIALIENKDLLKHVSVERIATELEKTLMGNYHNDILASYKEVIEVFIPEFKDVANFQYKDNCQLIYNLEKHYPSRLAIFLHNIPNYADVLRRLKLSNKMIEETSKYIKHYLDFVELNTTGFLSLLKELSIQEFYHLIELQKGINFIDEFTYLKSISLLDEIAEKKLPYNLKMLDINGADLIELGYNNQKIGIKLNYLLDEVIKGNVDNKKNELIYYLKKNNNQKQSKLSILR